jgi:hypothetical protein
MKKLLLKTCLIIIVLNLSSCSGITVTGRVAVKGNEPHTYTVIIDDEIGSIKVVGEYLEEIRDNYQNRYIRVKGNIIKESAGPGMPAEFEVTEIIEIRTEPF